MTRDEEQKLLRRGIASIESTTGQRIKGWIVRSFPSVHTRSLLVEEGGFLTTRTPARMSSPTTSSRTASPSSCPLLQGLQRHQVPIAPSFATPTTSRTLTLGLDYLVDEARRGHGGRMMTVGLHSRWSGQAARASAVRGFIEHVLATDGACFMRRVDIAEHWLAEHPPKPGRG